MNKILSHKTCLCRS